MLAAGLHSSEDPLLASFSQPVAPKTVNIELGVQQFDRELWADRNGNIVNFGHANTLGIVDTDGVTKSVKGFIFDLRILWAVDNRNLLELSIPYYNQEFSQYNPGQMTPNLLDDPTVRRADASGDLLLSYRRSLISKGPLRAGLGLEFSSPTGQGPFESSNPLVATGSGGFSGALALDLESGAGAWLTWLNARVPYSLGYSADIAAGTVIAYNPDGSPEELSGGRDWVSQAFSYDAILGLGWDWYVTNSVRHRLAVEIKLNQSGAMQLDGRAIADSAQETLNVVPEARFAFADGLAINLGWITPLGYYSNEAFSYFGEVLIRADLVL